MTRVSRAAWMLFACAALLLLSVPRSHAQRLFGTTGTGAAGSSTLVEIDPATGGLISSIGPVGYLVNGLEFDPTTGILYGTTSVNDATFNGLITIDLTTGAGTPAGVHQWGLGTGGSESVTNLAISSVGAAFGWWDPGMDDLVSIDLGTGIATLVGESGVGTAANGLAFDLADMLWMVNAGGSIYTVDPTTGASTYTSGELGITAHHGSFQPGTGVYYGIDTTSGPRSLVLADLAAATYSTLPTVDDLHTLAFQPGEVAPVPEPSALMLLGAGALSALGFKRRRR